jgi:hypothetical protein
MDYFMFVPYQNVAETDDVCGIQRELTMNDVLLGEKDVFMMNFNLNFTG